MLQSTSPNQTITAYVPKSSSNNNGGDLTGENKNSDKKMMSGSMKYMNQRGRGSDSDLARGHARGGIDQQLITLTVGSSGKVGQVE